MAWTLVQRGWRRWRSLVAAARDVISTLVQSGPSQAGDALHRQYRGCLMPDQSDYANWVRLYDSLGPNALGLLARRARELADGPLVSILVPVYETPECWLRRCIDSGSMP